jgi:uncharacterized protein YqhQ
MKQMTDKPLKLPSYGGQALIEGVLMRGKYGLAAAMRSPEGEIIIKKEELQGLYKSKVKKIPFLRGSILIWDALGLGMRFLTMSANLQTEEDEKIEGPMLYITLISSLALAVAIFFLSPALISEWIENLLGWSAWVGNIVEGIIRLIITILYIWGIGRMKDIQDVFTYHGAEHKTINAFEADAELTPESVKQFSVEHPRCGTSFMLTLVILSIILFTLLGDLTIFWRMISRILLIPILAGISYEFIRWTSDHMDLIFVRWLTRPNMALQRLTTREPDLKVIEVSIAAFNAMLELENELASREGEEIIPPIPGQQVDGDELGYQNQPG